ncbi:threonine dehydrogenase-like Zn-dependent dehydrogenase [Micromonospora pisi]|uniref:Threonine dehydrogenase-like Zn-dependent dehydrogenase n=1 Tax=Micromonospora pisi TaxID=589240 RepID=A0A495JUJ2_9ACTN|nr:zinc-binding alcohol dehydrogenase [Micromonospora pisi]RKR92501.1 threonine dehydrogenase-like Zn-dependent dehydrogenase [Micromonospora pisi]
MPDRVIVMPAPGEVTIREEESGPARPGTFRVRTLYTGVSAGTELSYLKGSNPYLGGSWNADLALFQPGEATTPYPVTRLGYMEVAQVTESRTPAVAEGTIGAMAYGHRTGYLADPLVDRFVPLPADLDPLLGVYVAHMGPICVNGLLHAAADLYGPDVRTLADGVRGRRVAVTGAGVVGVLTALLAHHHGAASVVVVDPTPQRRAVAAALGLETLDPDAEDPAVLLKTRWAHGPGDRGADVVFQCRGQGSALRLGLRLLRPQGTVVDLAFYQSGADEVRFGEEFHHNGLVLRCAQIGRVPRGLAPTWDRERLSGESMALLRAYGELVARHLVSAVVPFEEGPTLLTELATGRRQETQVVLAC